MMKGLAWEPAVAEQQRVADQMMLRRTAERELALHWMIEQGGQAAGGYDSTGKMNMGRAKRYHTVLRMD